MICLYCHQKITTELNLLNLFSYPRRLCEDCHLKLTQWRRGVRCQRCHRIMRREEEECHDCDFINRQFKPVRSITCLLDYNSEVKMLMHRYKFVRDIALREVMAYFINIKERQYDHIVPIPISDHRFQERGFNQITEVLKKSGITYIELLSTDKVKLQSELSKAERINSDNPFTFNKSYEDVKLFDTRILIVDDIYTTGITVHQASEVLLQLKPAFVDVLTFSKA